jgi:hypothetical protein
MMARPFGISRPGLHGLACAVGLACVGCNPMQSAPPPCSAALPAQAALLGAPEFATLRYHRREAIDAVQGRGSDLWADERFEYRAAVEFGFVRAPGAVAGNLCADTVSIRIVLPADEPRRGMLRAFVRTIAARSAMSADDLAGRVEELAARRARYGPLVRHESALVEAGVLPHPKWGDVFVVAFVAR